MGYDEKYICTCGQDPLHDPRSSSQWELVPRYHQPDHNYQSVIEHPSKTQKNTRFAFVHTKHYERYFNRHFKVSVCAAKGERKTMEDHHLCQFTFANHEHYSLFGIFDGHNGSEASHYVADNLYKALNDLPDLEDSDAIMKAVEQMDKEFLEKTQDNAGSTIVFVLTFHQTVMNDAIHDIFSPLCPTPSPKVTNNSSFGYGNMRYSGAHPPAAPSTGLRRAAVGDSLLAGFESKHSGRVFWCGDARAFIVRSADDDFENTFSVLTTDHNTDNPDECERVIQMGGKIINNRVDGKLGVTRAFGDRRMKYEGSPVICKCEYKEFNAEIGYALLLSCDGLTEKWSDKTLMEKLEFNLKQDDNKDDDWVDTAKAMGGLVDDAIAEGSDDNVSVMIIQFKDGRKHQTNIKYENV
eukprot:905638_1